MAKGLEDILLELLGDPASVAAQADLTQAVALARQDLSFRQRAGAAAVQLRRARAEGADAAEIAEIEARLEKRLTRQRAAAVQAAAADVKRPAPDKGHAQIFGRATGTVEKPPLTLAALDKAGDVVAQKAAAASGILHLKVKGDLTDVTLQISDCDGRVLFRSPGRVSVPAGDVLYLDAPLSDPEPEPCPVPSRARMPDLVGQSEGVAVTLLERIGAQNVKTRDRVGDGLPGIVLEQSPDAGTVLGDKTAITLTIRRERAGQPPVLHVPGLIGMTSEAALKRLKDLALVGTLSPRAHDGPEGMVLLQAPAEGAEIDAGGTVTLTVSQSADTAPRTVTVPDLAGMTRDLVLEILKATDLRAEISETADSQGAAGVTGQDPTAGTVVKRKSTVRVQVNTPPEADGGKVVVPNLQGRDLGAAEEVLKALKLRSETSRKADAAPNGQVIGQDPDAGARVDPESIIALTVSAGPKGKGGTADDLTRLVRAMARDPRAEEMALDDIKLASMLRAGGINDLDAARTLAEQDPEDLRVRMKMGKLKDATTLRAMLRKSLRDAG